MRAVWGLGRWRSREVIGRLPPARRCTVRGGTIVGGSCDARAGQRQYQRTPKGRAVTRHETPIVTPRSISVSLPATLSRPSCAAHYGLFSSRSSNIVVEGHSTRPLDHLCVIPSSAAAVERDQRQPKRSNARVAPLRWSDHSIHPSVCSLLWCLDGPCRSGSSRGPQASKRLVCHGVLEPRHTPSPAALLGPGSNWDSTAGAPLRPIPDAAGPDGGRREGAFSKPKGA